MRAGTRYGADEGRDGKGIVYLFAAGNDCEGPTCALPGYGWANFDWMRYPQLLAICAVDANGKHPGYSTLGSNLLVCAPSSGDREVVPGITTALLRVTFPSYPYTHIFGGTSAAAPMVSGVVALMLEANPNLTWRDVRLILARTACILPSMETADAQWVTTHATNPYTQKPYRYSLRYGFGLVDADAAVNYAKHFQTVGESSKVWWETQGCTGEVEKPWAWPLPWSKTPISMSCDAKKIEIVEIEIGLEHPRFRDLKITLTTPSGAQIPLTDRYPNCGTQSNGYQCPTSDFGNVYRTSTTMPLDETASGVWKLHVTDTGTSGAWKMVKHVALTVH